jgi:hypothetical protein
MLGLIALFSSYDHLTIAGRNVPIPQPWGIPLIAASVAIVFVVAAGCAAVSQLATGSRLRAAQEATRMEDVAAGRRSRSSLRKKPSSCRRSRPEAMARDRQSKSFEGLDQAAVLSARVQLDPTDTNRARLRTFLTLISNPSPDDGNPES